MEAQEQDGEADQLGASLPWAGRGQNGKGDSALMGREQTNELCSKRGRGSHSEARAPPRSLLSLLATPSGT